MVVVGVVVVAVVVCVESVVRSRSTHLSTLCPSQPEGYRYRGKDLTKEEFARMTYFITIDDTGTDSGGHHVSTCTRTVGTNDGLQTKDVHVSDVQLRNYTLLYLKHRDRQLYKHFCKVIKQYVIKY